MSAARSAVDMLLREHEPYPVVVVDRLWNVIRANRAMDVLLGLASPELLADEPNVMRLALHPQGLPQAVDYGEARVHPQWAAATGPDNRRSPTARALR
ncbi:MmyB family transcriptional regulator [Streptomyces rimosus]|uniref:MmyB family transcriptional regulator n=1 Tax=Streptomyces rimosus TaxID=1927 RepID=UPI0007C47B25|nr:hypothetical protein [Streptomyces rimosus]